VKIYVASNAALYEMYVGYALLCFFWNVDRFFGFIYFCYGMHRGVWEWGVWGEYLGLRVTRQQESGENFIMRSFMISGEKSFFCVLKYRRVSLWLLSPDITPCDFFLATCVERTLILFNRDSCLDKYTFLVIFFVAPSASKVELYCASQRSSVGIATDYGLDGPGIESRWGRDFSHTSRPALGPTQQNGYRVFPRGKTARAWSWPPTPF
jgi:hypothetical protein